MEPHSGALAHPPQARSGGRLCCTFGKLEPPEATGRGWGRPTHPAPAPAQTESPSPRSSAPRAQPGATRSHQCPSAPSPSGSSSASRPHALAHWRCRRRPHPGHSAARIIRVGFRRLLEPSEQGSRQGSQGPGCQPEGGQGGSPGCPVWFISCRHLGVLAVKRCISLQIWDFYPF